MTFATSTCRKMMHKVDIGGLSVCMMERREIPERSRVQITYKDKFTSGPFSCIATLKAEIRSMYCNLPASPVHALYTTYTTWRNLASAAKDICSPILSVYTAGGRHRRKFVDSRLDATSHLGICWIRAGVSYFSTVCFGYSFQKRAW